MRFSKQILCDCCRLTFMIMQVSTEVGVIVAYIKILNQHKRECAVVNSYCHERNNGKSISYRTEILVSLWFQHNACISSFHENMQLRTQLSSCSSLFTLINNSQRYSNVHYGFAAVCGYVLIRSNHSYFFPIRSDTQEIGLWYIRTAFKVTRSFHGNSQSN